MIKLLDIIQKDFKFLTNQVPTLEVGIYEIKKYYLTEDSKFVKILYLETDKGFYQTKSRVMIGLIYGIVGKILDNAISNNEIIEVEVINQRSVRGYMSLSFRLI